MFLLIVTYEFFTRSFYFLFIYVVDLRKQNCVQMFKKTCVVINLHISAKHSRPPYETPHKDRLIKRSGLRHVYL